MKRTRLKIAAALMLAVMGGEVLANNMMFVQRLKGMVPIEWTQSDPLYGEWIDVGSVYGCTNWSPDPSTVTVGQAFTQSATDCKQDQTRTVQDRELEVHSGALRNVGEPYTEAHTITASASRQAVGALETWAATSPTYTSWTNSGSVYGCTNWSPSPETVTIGQSFTQTATDCKQDQTRTVQNREVETTTGEIRNVGEPYTESQTIAASSTRQTTGTKETWVVASPTYTSWVDTNSLYGCTNWSPAGSTKTATSTFTQTATDCETDQSRTRQEREQETTTLAYRDVGSLVTETRTLTSQTATRSYTVTLGTWTNSGGVYGCSNWSPDPSTVTSGQTFTQTATDCEQNQTRSRVEKYVDHKTGATVQTVNTTESRTLTGQTSTRTATGTKAAATCAYTAYKTEWHYYIDFGYSGAFWNGAQVGEVNGQATSFKGTDGRTYSRGSFVMNDGDPYMGRVAVYQVCRQ